MTTTRLDPLPSAGQPQRGSKYHAALHHRLELELCGSLIRERNWQKSKLGGIEAWSHELRATVGNIVNSPVAKVLMWGPEHIMLYNDAYSGIAGDRHPIALGTPVAQAFPEVWDWNRPIL